MADRKAMKEDTLNVPGARLYYRVQGAGPLLLVLQGGAGAAEGADALVERLADQYAVVTYDRRGLSRSVVDDPAATPGIAAHVDDASQLLAALTAEPARVVGFSFGALLGLELAARYPEQVRLLVAHEPPVPQVLPPDEQAMARAEQLSVEDAFKTEGVLGAMRRFMVLSQATFADVEPGVSLPRPTGERAQEHTRNFAFFLAHDSPAAHRHTVDLPVLEAVLSAGRTRAVVGAGSTDTEAWINHCAHCLAERLNVDVVNFPGGHNGFVTHPGAFAERLLTVLS